VDQDRSLGDFTIGEPQKRFKAGHHEQRCGWIYQIEVEMMAALKNEIAGVCVGERIGVSDGMPMAWMFTGVNNRD
jgi:hypothetical protein